MKKLKEISKNILSGDFSRPMIQWFSKHKTDSKVDPTIVLITLPVTWKNKRWSVIGMKTRIVYYKRKEEMRSCTSLLKIGQRLKVEYRERLIERIRTGTKQLSLKRLEDSCAGTGPHQISILKITLLKKTLHQVGVRARKY